MHSLFRSCFRCFAKKSSRIRKLFGFSLKDYNILVKGEQKVIKELDCINLINRLRQLDLLTSLYLSTNQKTLLNYSKRNILRQEVNQDSSSEEEEVENHTLLQTLETRRNLEKEGMTKTFV
jgi:hypothetical protein